MGKYHPEGGIQCEIGDLDGVGLPPTLLYVIDVMDKPYPIFSLTFCSIRDK